MDARDGAPTRGFILCKGFKLRFWEPQGTSWAVTKAGGGQGVIRKIEEAGSRALGSHPVPVRVHTPILDTELLLERKPSIIPYKKASSFTLHMRKAVVCKDDVCTPTQGPVGNKAPPLSREFVLSAELCQAESLERWPGTHVSTLCAGLHRPRLRRRPQL